MKYYIIAGEASGDLHASNLIKQIKDKDSQADFRAWGGDLMSAVGADVVKHYKELAFMGFVEVLFNIRTILKNFKLCEKDILDYSPDVIVLVDYPGFNLRIAKFAKENGFKVIYYISPQIWAWKQSRVKQIRKYVDRVISILPFEKDFFAKHNVSADYVGHPLLDAFESYEGTSSFRERNSLGEKPIIALLPGSRKQEIKTSLPIMAALEKDFSDYQFVIAASPSQELSFYKRVLNGIDIKIVVNSTYDLLSDAEAALVTSGTATLETALFKVPEVVCYKANVISYHIAKLLVKVKFISLVNLIMDKEIVRELIQNDFTVSEMKKELQLILFDEKRRTDLLENYDKLEEKLGGGGASEKAAKIIVEELN